MAGFCEHGHEFGVT